MSTITIDSVVAASPSGTSLRGHLDSPIAGVTQGAVLAVAGWVISSSVPVVSVLVVDGARLTKEGVVDVPRDDLAGEGPVPVAGFHVNISVLDLPPEFTCTVFARLADGIILELGNFRGSRDRLAGPSPEMLQPLLVTCLGRTGSTWLMRLASCHPQIVGYRPFNHEARVGSYWAAVFASLSSVDSISQLLDPPDVQRPLWWTGLESKHKFLSVETEEWAIDDHVHSLAKFCRSRIESFYRRVATADTTAVYFAEKYVPGVASMPLRELYPDLRELILVRDFRDMAASVLAFNSKRGYQAFGRQDVASDEDYVREIVVEIARQLLAHWEEHRDTAVLVRYEDLVSRPATELKRIFAEIALQADPQTVSEVMDAARRQIPAMEFHRTSSDPASSIGRWRDLPPALAALVNTQELRDLLREFGYDVETLTASP